MAGGWVGRGGRNWGAAVEEGEMCVCVARGGEEGEGSRDSGEVLVVVRRSRRSRGGL